MQKSVQITVYVVKPRRTNQENISVDSRKPLQTPAGGGGATAGGYDRKAQLLLYSQLLRSIAYCELKGSVQKSQSTKKINEVIQIVSSYKSQEKVKEVLKNRTNQKLTETLMFAKKVVPAELHTTNDAKLPQSPPSCFREWRNIFLPSFISRIFGGRNGKNENNNKKKKLSESVNEKRNAIMMSSMMEKERIGVMAKYISLSGKRS